MIPKPYTVQDHRRILFMNINEMNYKNNKSNNVKNG